MGASRRLTCTTRRPTRREFVHVPTPLPNPGGAPCHRAPTWSVQPRHQSELPTTACRLRGRSAPCRRPTTGGPSEFDSTRGLWRLYLVAFQGDRPRRPADDTRRKTRGHCLRVSLPAGASRCSSNSSSLSAGDKSSQFSQRSARCDGVRLLDRTMANQTRLDSHGSIAPCCGREIALHRGRALPF